MRWTIAAGLFLLTILFGAAPAALAQASGEVQSIGFNGAYRPDAWVPMVVRLKPDTADAGNYQIQVYQHDLDGDRAIYVRPITLNGNTTAADQLFWMYFLPQPINKGLPDQSNGGSLRDLQKDLVVFLCDAKGKQLVQLPVTSTLNNVDPVQSNASSANPRGRKLVLAVSGNGSQQAPMTNLTTSANMPSNTIGLMNDVEVVNLRVRDLPENALGYDAVDAVLWLDGDPADLDAGGAHGLAALRDYVRFGGQLIVTQPTSAWQSTANFGDLMPVDVTGVDTKPAFEPLRSLAHAPDTADEMGSAVDAWSRVHGPFQMARATARPGAIVEDWIDWKGDGSNADATPYLARRAAGLGQVTWVAQPLTTDAQPANEYGWPYVWMHVFGWRSDAFVPPPQPANLPKEDWPDRPRLERYKDTGDAADLGYALMSNDLLNLGSKGAWLIVLAIGFFVVYWLLAGPGTYGYLVAKKRQGLSWFFFGGAALLATAVTVGVVKLVLRGPPQVKHLSMVRVTPGQPTIVYSRFGLYIPRDGDQTIDLQDAAPGQLSYLSALAEHPQILGDASEGPSPLDYDVPVREASATDAPSLTVPYRSSLKKFQARWVGDLPARLGTGAGMTLDLDPAASRLPLRGTLTNETGQDLTDVFLAFHLTGDRDWMVYVPTWAKGTPLDMQRDLLKLAYFAARGTESPRYAQPGQNKVVSDELVPRSYRIDAAQTGWANLWFSAFHRSSAAGDDAERDFGLTTSFPMLSVLDRLPPMPNLLKNGGPEFDDVRSEFFARGARMLDAGPSLQAGQLLVLATAHGPLPVPVQVDGDRVPGDGTTLYQFVLPIDRGTADKPTTQPSER